MSDQAPGDSSASNDPAPASVPAAAPEKSDSASALSGGINYAAIAIAVGGFLGFVGVLAGWFQIQVLVTGGQVVQHTDAGTTYWGGQLVLVASIMAFAAGIVWILMKDAGIRRGAAIVAAIAAVLMLLGTVLGFFYASKDLIGASWTQANGLYISFVGAAAATVGAALLWRTNPPSD